MRYLKETTMEMRKRIANEFLKEIHEQCCNHCDEDWSHCGKECPVSRRMFCHIHAVAPYKWNYKQIEEAVNKIFGDTKEASNEKK